MPVFGFVALSLLVLLLFSGYFVFYMSCVRRKELPWDSKEALNKTPYGRYYENILAGEQFLQEHAHQDIYIRSHDGLTLYGVFIPAEHAKGTILLAHGYRSNKLIDFGLVLDFYHDAGLNILAIDQRAHGKSTGRYITFGVKECWDVMSWIDWHNKAVGEVPFILSGLSMGASTVLYLADADLPENVKGIIADCGFTSPKDIIRRVYESTVHLPAAPSLWVADLFARIFAGFRFSEKDTKVILRNNKLPVLLVHGVDDGFVPCDMTRQAYEACAGNKEMFLVEGADHGVSFLIDRPGYTQRVIRFLKENVEGLQ